MTSAAVVIVLRWLLAVFFVVAGIAHFVKPGWYVKIVPPMFPAAMALVLISGAAEIAGGVGVLIPALRVAAGWGLIALLIAVFPANISMAMDPKGAGMGFPLWTLYGRLPLQFVMIVWVWFVALRR